MARFHIDPSWIVDCDEMSCQLIELRVITGDNARGRQPKAENIGKIREESHGFYGTMEQALRAYLRKSVQGADLTTAQAVVEAIVRAEQSVTQACILFKVTKPEVLAKGA